MSNAHADILDPTICCLTLPNINVKGTGDVRHRFWHRRVYRERLTQMKPHTFVAKICRDHLAFLEEVVRETPTESPLEHKKICDTPIELDDQLAEATPQFTLRNIPKIERYYDLDALPPFRYEDLPRVVAEDLVDQARSTRVEPAKFHKFTNMEILKDYRTFLQEILYLCPWENIPKGEVSEDNPWHIKHSYAKIAIDMQKNKDIFFVYGHEGAGVSGSFTKHGFSAR